MLTLTIALAAFAFLYGFVWHNQPARASEDKTRTKRN